MYSGCGRGVIAAAIAILEEDVAHLELDVVLVVANRVLMTRSLDIVSTVNRVTISLRSVGEVWST